MVVAAPAASIEEAQGRSPVASSPSGAAVQRLSYPLPPDGRRERYGFEYELLRAALQAQGGGVDELQWSERPMTLARARVELAAGHLRLVHSVQTPELDHELLPVPFAIDKGLNSARVLLTRCELLPRLAQVRDARELADLRFGVLSSWSDRQALKALGFRVEPTESFPGLFKMLALQRSDLILTGVLYLTEVRPQLAAHAGLCVEPQLLLKLPSELRYYTRRDAEGEALARRILQGLQKLQASGDFERLLQHHFGPQSELVKDRRALSLGGTR